jgi:hypothetical protein
MAINDSRYRFGLKRNNALRSTKFVTLRSATVKGTLYLSPN